MAKTYAKRDFPVSDIRRFLEPGPIVLVSSQFRGKSNIMTMGWHMVLGFEPSLVGCYIWDANYSFEIIRKSRQCVINIPETTLTRTVVAIGNCSGRDVDKFSEFGLSKISGEKVKAPLIKECYANFECILVDSKLIKNYGIFVFEIVKAHVAKSPRFPKTLHYRGDGLFMISGPTVSKYRKWFKPQNL